MKALIFMSLFISNFVIGQKTFYKLLSHEEQNVATGLEFDSNRFILSSGAQTINAHQYKTQTNITAILIDGTPVKKLEITKLNAKKFGIFDSLFVFNRLAKNGDNFLISGHNAGKVRETKFHIFNADLMQQKEFSIPYTNVDRIGNEGIFIEDSMLYSYGLSQIGEVYYANILKYNLITNTIIWDKNYKIGKRLNEMWDFQKTHDGNFIFIMYHRDNDAGTGSNAGYQIVKIDKNGAILDTFDYEDIRRDKQRILASEEGAIYYTTKNNPLDPIIPTNGRINKLSENMDSILWSIELPSNAFTDGNRYEIFDYYQAANGDIMACGRVWHMPGGPLVAGLNASWNGFVTRVTQKGDLKWLRIYRLPNDNPKLPNDKFGDFRYGQIDKIIETEGGDFVLGGTAAYTPTQLDGLKNGDTISSIWLMVVDKIGCIEGEECENVIHLDSKKQIISEPKLVNDKVSWTEKEVSAFDGSISSHKYKFSEDSIFFSTLYYKELLSSTEQFGSNYTGLNRYFREENNRIYEYNQNQEILMYDFNLNLNDTFNVENPLSQITFPITVNIILDSTLLLNDEHRRTIAMYCKGIEPTLTTWIDGIGSTSGFLSVYNSCAFDINTTLNCFYINDTLAYINPESKGCWTTATSNVKTVSFSIIPNPSKDKIEIKGEVDFDKINIYSITGIKMKNFQKEKIIDVSELRKGLYIIELERKGHSLGKQKFVKSE